jgi:hypothetical protein
MAKLSSETPVRWRRILVFVLLVFIAGYMTAVLGYGVRAACSLVRTNTRPMAVPTTEKPGDIEIAWAVLHLPVGSS